MSTFAEVFLGMIAAQAFRAFLLALISHIISTRNYKKCPATFPDGGYVKPSGIARTMLGFY